MPPLPSETVLSGFRWGLNIPAGGTTDIRQIARLSIRVRVANVAQAAIPNPATAS